MASVTCTWCTWSVVSEKPGAGEASQSLVRGGHVYTAAALLSWAAAGHLVPDRVGRYHVQLSLTFASFGVSTLQKKY